jgi:hypothetical protein
MNTFMLMEAINSVALSHEEGHDCLVCRAADGDEESLAKLAALISPMFRN